jgi:hypothetical protein
MNSIQLFHGASQAKFRQANGRGEVTDIPSVAQAPDFSPGERVFKPARTLRYTDEGL